MNIRHFMSAGIIALALTAFSLPASAGSSCHGKYKCKMMTSCMYKYCGKKPRCYPGLVRGQCQVIPGHWWNTTWVPASKACWYLRG